MINFEKYSSSRISLNNMYTEHKILIYSWFLNKYEIDLDNYPDINKPNIIKYIMLNNIDLKCVCGKIKRWNRNKFLTTCGDKNCTHQTRCDTNIKKYGGNTPMSSQTVIGKIKDSWTKVDREELKEKKRKTCIEKYGGTSPISSTEVQDKMKQTLTDKYGVDNYSKVSNFKEIVSSKISQTKLNNDIKLFRTSTQNIKNLNKEYFEKTFIDNDGYLKLYDAMNYYNYQTDTSIYKFMIQNNIKYKKRFNTSHLEKQVLEFLLQNDIKCQTQVRHLQNISEIDILSNNLAIEFDGLFWHSYTNHSKQLKSFFINRHVEKTDNFEKLSNEYQMLHIFENEWLDDTKRDIWKSMISNILKLNSERVFARKCIVKEISTTEANTFILKNHMQGIRNTNIKLGLYYNNELVSVMTLGKPLDNNSEYEYELIRFCNKKYTNVIGGASKLLKYFEKTYKPKSLLSYANRRWSKGNLYHKLGFELQNISKPNKFVVKGNKLFNRIGFQKYKLKDKLDKYDKNLSADDNIINNNYGLIWDCGNYVFTKIY